jgi:hypothetical protein
MLKTILLLLLCLPLVWIAWIEIRSLAVAPTLIAEDDNANPVPAELSMLKEQAAAVILATDSVKKSVLRLDDSAADPAISSSKLYKALSEHVNARRGVRDRIDGERGKAAAAGPSDHPEKGPRSP